MQQERYKWLPYKAIKMYVLMTLVLALLGPVNYGFDFFYGFITVLYVLTFLFVTRYAMQNSSSYQTFNFITSNRDKKLLLVLKIAILVSLLIKVMLVISSIKIYGTPSFSDFFSTLANVYTNMHYGEFIGNVYRQIDTFCTFIFYFALFVGAFWFRRINWLFRLFLILTVLFDQVYQVLYIGTQRSIITIGILAIVLYTRSTIKKDMRIDKRKLRRILILFIVLFIIFLNILSARKELWDPSYYNSNKRFNLDHPLLFMFGSAKTRYDVCNVISYLTQGWYGLSLSFQVPFKWTWLLGGFRGLNSIYSQVFTFIPNLTEFTYPVRAGEMFNFDGLASWYTIFPWLASDFTFIGALIYMYFAARIYMKAWIQALKYDNPIAFVIVVILTIQYVFIVANNQIFVQRGEALATVLLFIIYFAVNKKYNYDF